MTEKMTRKEATTRGLADGEEAVDEHDNENPDADWSSQGLNRGWDEAAINAGAAEIVGIPRPHREAYYKAYTKGAAAAVARRKLRARRRRPS